MVEVTRRKHWQVPGALQTPVDNLVPGDAGTGAAAQPPDEVAAVVMLVDEGYGPGQQSRLVEQPTDHTPRHANEAVLGPAEVFEGRPEGVDLGPAGQPVVADVG